MKICFSGAHRTGKTSLAERVALENDFIMYYTNVSSVIGKVPVKEIECLVDRQGFFRLVNQQKDITDHIKEMIKSGEDYSVFDRSPLDVYSYSEYFLGKILSEGFKPSEFEIRIYDNHLKYIKQYFSMVDFTFIVQPGIDFIEAEKSCSKETQEALNEVFLNIAGLYFPREKYFVIPRDITDFEERVEICKKVLKEKLDTIRSIS